MNWKFFATNILDIFINMIIVAIYHPPPPPQINAVFAEPKNTTSI